ncbi:hypothetical protein M2284_002632 [Rhodococcus sp. LBL1]|nr:hypothetical protein [Rhodococcus sp. LBL1]MDH6684016.1 hypothetical protein [Rhodococcus sp. LBL2]
MARDHTRIHLSIWNDDDFRDLSPRAQHLYFVLMTSPTVSYCGVGDWRPARIMPLAASWTVDEFDAAAVELAERLYVVIDEGTEEFLVRSFVRNDGLMKQPKMAVAMAKAFATVASRSLRGVAVHELQRLRQEFPDLHGWGSEQASELLGKASVDPSTYPTGFPSVKGSVKGKSTPSSKGSGEGSTTPAPTPTPLLLTPKGGSAEPTADGQSPEQRATSNAYERVGKALNYNAVLQQAKWAIHTRGADPHAVEEAFVGLYEMGKPITRQLVGQWLDGHLMNPRRPGVARADEKIQNVLDMGARIIASRKELA